MGRGRGGRGGRRDDTGAAWTDKVKAALNPPEWRQKPAEHPLDAEIDRLVEEDRKKPK